MADLIQNAINTVKSSATNQIQSTGQQITSQLDVAAAPTSDQLLEDALGQLPDVPDPEIILLQKEAEVFEKKTEIEEQLLFYEENAIELIKQELIKLTLANSPIPLPLKLPLIDPKILQAYAMYKQIKKALKNRKKKSKTNQTRGKKLYTYPLKDTLTKIPTPPVPLPLPKPPEFSLPKVNVPPLPTLPKLNNTTL